MSYYINLQKAIDYIEDNLEGKVELDEIAKVAGYSIPHFYRVFGAIIGCSVKEYVRKRKLSQAVFDVVTTKRSITDIAFEYGFESHEVFTRTFKLAYGAPPSSFRKTNVEPNLFERINLLSIKNESGMVILKPEIICKDEKMLLGISRKINQSENIKYGLLAKVQSEFMKIADSIENRIDKDIYYAVYDYDPIDIIKEDDKINYTYYYCVEVSKCESIPEGMVKKLIPQGKYAVFTLDLKNDTLNGEILNQPVYDYIDGIWLPNSGFELAETSDYEIINEKESLVNYYISIK
ncbi:helix-turn-helix domain-containing protein [Clostridium sp. C2-6-12]|uniref:AraC family transcriptional regulator n=1 Tax=Clostridium sp. C2-6-12 TaxID=2698832 RepID=UPI00136B393B|nr:helix-turn-helix domain-containing protein [Clostridium sp. C2-6-12]